MNPFFSLASLLDWGFSVYDEPLPEEAPFLSARACQSCHAQTVAEWEKSRHAQAWTNPLFQEGYIAEPDPTCVYCHAPHKEQWKEIQKNQAWVESMHPEKGSLLHHPFKYPEPKAEEGITCATCHVRSGRMIASEEKPHAAHPITVDPRLKTSVFCKDCHDFPIFERDDGVLHVSSTKMQTTYQEWQEWNEEGGGKECQSCHMPNGNHEFHGGNHRTFLHSSIKIELQKVGDKAQFTIRSHDVGHHLPTGDLFRHLTLDFMIDGEWKEMMTIGRDFSLEWDGGKFTKVLVSDTSLRPNIPQVYTHPWKTGTQWRLVYHYGSKVDEMRALLPSSILTEVIALGRLKQH